MLGIIFDCDGTLIDSDHNHFLAWKTALHRRGVSFKMDDYISISGQPVTISKILHEKFHLDDPDVILRDKKNAYRELQNRSIQPIKRTVDFVRKLAQNKHEMKFRLGLASAATKEEILLNIQLLDLDDIFDVVVSGVDDLLT